MLKWKTICCKNNSGVSFTTACLRRTPEKFMGLAGAYIQRRLVHSYMQRVEPDSEVYIYADKCFRNNPVSEDQLKDYCKQKAALLLENSGTTSTDSIDEHLKTIDANVCNLMKIDIKALDTISNFFTDFTGKHFHASTMLLLAKAMGKINPNQTLFAEVIEMTFAANFLHTQVADCRPEEGMMHKVIGNKGIILGGDYLISNASIQCCRMNSLQLIQLLCIIIQNMTMGSVLQIKADSIKQRLMEYCTISYYKTASLIANGCKGVAILGQSNNANLAYEYGKHLGMALKVISDVRDLMNNKITHNSFPVLYASKKYPQIQTLIDQGELNLAIDLVYEGKGLDWSRKMALHHIEAALSSIECLGDKGADLNIFTRNLTHNLY